MADLNDYLNKRGITEEQMQEGEERLDAYIQAYNLREARKALGMTQEQVAINMGVTQERVSHMEKGDISVMSIENIQRYVHALGGDLHIVADLPMGQIALV